jgi:hypothetical protein
LFVCRWAVARNGGAGDRRIQQQRTTYSLLLWLRSSSSSWVVRWSHTPHTHSIEQAAINNTLSLGSNRKIPPPPHTHTQEKREREKSERKKGWLHSWNPLKYENNNDNRNNSQNSTIRVLFYFDSSSSNKQQRKEGNEASNTSSLSPSLSRETLESSNKKNL